MNSSFWYSVIGHILIGALFFISLPTFEKKQNTLDVVPIFIDLKNIEIAEKTNLPPKAKTQEIKKVAVPKIAPSQKTKVEAKKVKKEASIEEVKPVQKVEKQKDTAQIIEPKVKKVKVPQKPKIKSEISSPKTKKVQIRSKPQQENEMDSLLASVEKMKTKSVKNSKEQKQTDVSDLISGVLNGIEGGKNKDLGTKLTVSQIDFIASTVRKNWNLDAGIEGVDDMIIEIRVVLGRDGRVSDVEFLNKNRYNSDAGFRSVAQSARRAILICDKLGDESPFRMLALKYPERYSDWQKIQLRFNPLDGGVS